MKGARKSAINDVGYQTKTMNAFMFVGPDFINCDGTEGAKIADLKINCIDDELDPDEGWYPDGDAIILLDNKGYNDHTLVYLNSACAQKYAFLSGETVTPGWYDEDDIGDEKFDNKYDNEPIDFGLAVQINAWSGNDNLFVQFSGEVKKQPTITDVANFMGVANCTPVEKTISEFKVNCIDNELDPDEGWYPDGDAIILLDNKGYNDHTLVYLNSACAQKYAFLSGETVTPGWYDEDDIGDDKFDNKYDNFKVAAGGGIQVNAWSGNDDITVQLDSPIAE